MTQPVADTGKSSTPARGAAAIAGVFLRLFYVVASVLIVSGIIVQIFVATARLMTPVDVSGTLLGGMGAAGNAVIWIAATGGVLLVVLLRLPGFRLAWIAAGGLPVVLGALALWHYPDDGGGNQIFSPQRSEIVWMMAIGGAFLASGGMLHRYVTVPRLSNRRLRQSLMTVRLLAMAGMAALFIAVPIVRQIEKDQPPLPPCAHDSMGRQLTVCLRPYRPGS